MTLRALGYVRQSKTLQNETNETSLSLDAQEARIRAYCEAQDWTLVAVHRDSQWAVATGALVTPLLSSDTLTLTLLLFTGWPSVSCPWRPRCV